MTTTTSMTMNRRSLLALGGLAAAATGAGLAGCGGSSQDRPQTGGGGDTSVLPDHIPFPEVSPDLPGDLDSLIAPGYFGYPDGADRVTTVDGEVGTGGDLSVFVITYSPPPPAVKRNAYWQAINEALNVNLKPTLVPTDFDTKLAAMLTGNDIPDIVTMHTASAWRLRGYESVVQDKFADLTELLSGGAVADYPNLARLPQQAWEAAVVAGKIHATPTLRIRTAGPIFTRPDIIEEAGANPEPTNKEEFEELCKAVTNGPGRRYAMAATSSWLEHLFFPMFSVPNGWRQESDGALTRDFETEEWEVAIAYIADTWKNGWWHPDVGGSSLEVEPLFANGTIALFSDNFVRYTVRGEVNFDVGLMSPFLAEGGKGAQYTLGPTDFLTFVKKGEVERVKECLRVIDWCSAPFGSEENFLRTYGVEGDDHTITDGEPVLTERGSSEVTGMSLRFVAGGPDVLYAQNGAPDMVKMLHDYQSDNVDNQLVDPTQGVYSPTESRTSAASQKIADTVSDVITGRSQVSALAEAVDGWRKAGGDKVREEYQAALEELPA